jgi:hypothetical protein
LRHTFDLIVNTIRIFFDNTTTAWSGSNSCYCFNFLVLILYFSCGHKIPYHRKSVQNYNKKSTYARKLYFFSLFSIIICAREIFFVILYAFLRMMQ